MEITMTTDTEALVRRAYHFAESAVLDVRGTFLGPFEMPAGVIEPTGAKLDIPTADFWYVRDGKIQEFNCHIGVATMFAQLGVLPDFASAVAASAPAR
jgi:hypothetical protein